MLIVLSWWGIYLRRFIIRIFSTRRYKSHRIKTDLQNLTQWLSFYKFHTEVNVKSKHFCKLFALSTVNEYGLFVLIDEGWCWTNPKMFIIIVGVKMWYSERTLFKEWCTTWYFLCVQIIKICILSQNFLVRLTNAHF